MDNGSELCIVLRWETTAMNIVKRKALKFIRKM